MGGKAECPDDVRRILASLGIAPESLESRFLVPHVEANQLEVAETGAEGRQHLLTPEAARAWRAMRESADADGVTLTIVSAFRTIERQAEIVRRKLQTGLQVETILCVSAPPGYSEHHSGRAVDVTTDGIEPLKEEFEATAAFRWLTGNGGRFGYSLSFPRGNRYGYAFEPWHWYFSDPTRIA